MNDKDRTVILRHIAALRDDARAMDATADLFAPEFQACWEREADDRLGQMVNGERALQLRSLVLKGRDDAKYNRLLANIIEGLLPPPPPCKDEGRPSADRGEEKEVKRPGL